MTVRVTRALLRGLSPTDAAALWKVQQDSGAPVEAGLFASWLEDDANAAAWGKLEDAWSAFDAADDAVFEDLRAAALAAGPWNATTTPWRWVAGAAAAVAVIGGAALLLPRPAKPPVVADMRDAGDILVASGGAVKAIVLPDGSRMTLDVDSRARVAFGNGRRVSLDRGRALFDVRHDSAHPFSVAARGRTIIDVGTRFEVGVAPSSLRVALFEGGGRIEGGGSATVLRPGQAFVANAGKPDRVSLLAPGAEALWRQGLAEFDNATLAEAIEQLNAGSEVKLVIVDPRVAALRVSGRFRLHDPLRFATTVAEILPVRVVRIDPARIELRYRR